MHYEQQKSLSRTLSHLSLSEIDLTRIGAMILEACDPKRFQIEVRSSDGQDSFRTDDPTFFCADAMPREVSVVTIAGQQEAGALSCRLELRAGVDGRCELTVQGSSVTVASGLFYELQRELEKRKLAGSWVSRYVNGFSVYLLLSALSGLAVYSVFDLPLNLAKTYVQGFRGSPLHVTIGTVGWLCVALAAIGGGFTLQSRAAALFPPVQFSGRLADPTTKPRLAAARAVGLVLLPILLNVLANFVTDLIKILTKG